MSQPLDKIDMQILEILQSNSSVSMKDIAEKVGLSITPSYERVKSMERDGYIKKYVALVNRKKLGIYLISYCSINTNTKTKHDIEEFEKSIFILPEVIEAVSTSGKYDYMLKIATKDIDSYNDFLVNKLHQLPFIAHYHSNIVLNELKNETAFKF